MRKIIVFVCFFLVLNLNIVNCDYCLNDSDKKIVDKIGIKIENIINNKWFKYKNILIVSLEKYLKKLEKGTKWYVLIDSLISKTYTSSLKKTYMSHYKSYKIDYSRVKSYWLNIHNSARINLWVKNYSYDSRLDNTAYEWTTIQSWKWIMEHKRNPDDSYYDYNKIEDWFNKRWINCKIKNGTTSSESIWKFWYYCSDNDCTDELTESIKVIFDIYMAEKWTGRANDAHYRAITHPDISKMWLWISIRQTNEKDYYEYYITTHYCTEFKN